MGVLDEFIRKLFGKKKPKKEEKKLTTTEELVKLMKETPKTVTKPVKHTPAKTQKPITVKKAPGKPKKVVKTESSSKSPKTEMEEAMKEFRNSITTLGEKIDSLDESIVREKIAPKQALGGAQVIYNQLKFEKKNVKGEIAQTKELMKFLEKDFLKRKITDDMFRKKLYDYREKLHILLMEQKELSSQKKDLSKTTKSIPQVAPVSLEKLAKTDNLEKLLVKQTATLEILAKQSAKRTKIEERVIKAAVPEQTERIETAMRFTTPMKKMDERTGVETQIKKYQIETDFDRILVFVEKKGRVKLGEIAKEIGISKKRVDECCKLLRNEKQVDIVYPTFGDAIVQTMDYKERAEMEKIKKNKNKKKGKRD